MRASHNVTDNVQEEYCPALDAAFVAAIFYDYADQPDGVAQARVILDSLKEDAVAEQYSEFDASGNSGGLINDSPSRRNGEDADSNADTWATQTTLTDHSHLSNDISGLSGGRSGSGSEGSQDGGYWRDAEHYTTPRKENVLAETFPNLRPSRTRYRSLATISKRRPTSC
jgi:hypothetical protein